MGRSGEGVSKKSYTSPVADFNLRLHITKMIHLKLIIGCHETVDTPRVGALGKMSRIVCKQFIFPLCSPLSSHTLSVSFP